MEPGNFQSVLEVNGAPLFGLEDKPWYVDSKALGSTIVP